MKRLLLALAARLLVLGQDVGSHDPVSHALLLVGGGLRMLIQAVLVAALVAWLVLEKEKDQ